MSTALHRVFVYGTLKRGQPNYHLLTDSSKGLAKWLGGAKLEKKYPLVVASQYNVPFLLDKEGEGKEVHGDLFDVDDEMLKVLDALEDHPNFYKRRTVSCVVDQGADTSTEIAGTTITCEAYLMYNFRPELLSLPHIGSYADTPERRYIRKDGRDIKDPHFDWYQEIKAQN